MTRRAVATVVFFAFVAVMVFPGPVAVAGCGISVAARPSVVNYPSSSLPSVGQPNFAETLNVNYTTPYVNRTIDVQYLSATGWRSVENFTGNFVGFTRTYLPLVAGSASFGANSVRAQAAACISDSAGFTIQADTGAVPTDALVYAAIGAMVAAFYFGGRRMGRRRFVFLAAAVYLALSPFTGHRYDVYFLLSSGIRALEHVNPFTPGTPPVYPGPLKWAYPPLYVPYSALSYLLYQVFTGTSLPAISALTHPSWLTSPYDVWQAFTPPSLPVLVFILKLPVVLSALATGVLLARMMRTDLAVVKWLANPLVILVAAVWGQLDPVATLLALAAVHKLEGGKPSQAYLLASFGAAVKVWPVLLIPLFLAVSLRRSGRDALEPLVAVLPAVLTTLVLYSLFGNPLDNLYVLAYARFVPTFGGTFSVNGLTWQQILVALGAPALPLFSWVGVPALAAVVLWVYYAREKDVTKWLVVSLMIVFLTYNFVNPQYFYWIVPFLMIQRRRMAVLAFSFIPIVYMMLAYDIFYFVSPAILPLESSLGASIVEQLKVSLFSQTRDISSFAAPLLPTLAYVWLVYNEVRRKGEPLLGDGGRDGTDYDNFLNKAN